jgi:MFS transporter, DHA2 family, multidrug resistance protein
VTIDAAKTVERQPQTVPTVQVRQLPQSGKRFAAILVATSLLLLIDATANLSVSTGLPYVQGVMATTPDETSWFLTLFNAPYYSAILLSPWLYARFGRKRLMIVSMLVFAAASFALSLSTAYEPMLALRFIQGAALGCVFVPAAILLFTSLPLNLLGLGIPYFALLTLGGGAAGPLLGGYFGDFFGAHSLYLPSAIATLAALALIWWQAPSPDIPQSHLRYDWFGIVLGLLCFVALQYLSNEGERRDWFDTPDVGLAAVIAVVSGTLLVVWELFITRSPYANLRLIKQYRNLAVGVVINVLLGALGYSVLLFSTYLQSEVSATATLAGLTIALRLCAYVVGIATAFILVSRSLVDVRIVIAVSALATTACLIGFAQQMTTTAEAATFILITLVFGVAFAMMSQPVPALLLRSLPLEHLPVGLSFYKLSAPVGLMLATGWIQTAVDHRAAAHLSDLAGSITLAQTPVRDYLGQGGSLGQLAHLTVDQAQTLALHDGMVFIAGLALLVAPCVAFFIIVKPRPA